MFNFMPLHGYGSNLAEDMINCYIASGALAQGKVVEPDSSDVLALATTWGYFLMEEVTADGPSEFERILGQRQWEVKASATTRVSVLIPKDGAVVRTKHVAQGAGEPALARDQIVILAAGVFTTDADAALPLGKIVGLPADTGMTGYYDVKLYVQR